MDKYGSIGRAAAMFAVVSLACGFFAPVAQATTISIDDSAETLVFKIDGNTCLPIGTPGAKCTTGIFGSDADIAFIGERAVTRIFTSVPSFVTAGRFGVLLTEGDTENISDIVIAEIADIAFGVRQTFFTFVSDPLTNADLDDSLVKALIAGKFFTKETGDEQDMGPLFRDANGNLRGLPFDLTLKVISDKAQAPEPATLALLCIGLAGLGGLRWNVGKAQGRASSLKS